MPAPFTDKAHDGYLPAKAQMHFVNMPAVPIQARAAWINSMSRQRSGIHTMSYVDAQDSGGQAGYYWNMGQEPGSGTFWIAQDAVPPIAQDNPVILPAPGPCQYSGCANYLYAPTTHGTFACWEITSAYNDNANNPGFTNYYLLMYDWCGDHDSDPTQFYSIPMDSNFFDTYVRTYSNADHRPQYVVEVIKYSDASWHVLLYNNLSQQYVDVTPWTAYGSADGGGVNGWTMFETHYNYHVQMPYTTECPSEPNIGASGLRFYTGSQWTYLGGYASLQVRGNPQQANGVPQCFEQNDSQNLYIVNSDPNDPNDAAWFGESTMNMRNPQYTSGGGLPGTGGGGGGGGGGTGGGGCSPRCLN